MFYTSPIDCLDKSVEMNVYVCTAVIENCQTENFHFEIIPNKTGL